MKATLIAAAVAVMPPAALAQTPANTGGATDTRALAAATQADMARLVLDKDMATFLQWFPGRYDNDAQVFFQDDLKVPKENQHERIHSIFTPVSLPAFGPNAFYVQQYLDGDPAKIYRQRIYTFEADYAQNAVRLRIFTPKPGVAARIVDAHKDPKKLSLVAPADFTNTPGCDVFWRLQENQFLGTMKPGACRITSSRDGRTIVITDSLVLTDSAIWINDQAVDEAGAYVFGNKANVPHKLDKVRPFQCWVSVLRGVKHGESGEGAPPSQWFFQRDRWIHDRDGRLDIVTDETPARKFYIRLKRVAWPWGAARPSMTLYVHEDGNPRALSYAWGGYDADRIGINTRWMQASCTYVPGAQEP
jgi:hypothetical protein